jgi:hypothetical protein
MSDYINRESDTDMAEVDEVRRTRTKKELDEEWERFKSQFKQTHDDFENRPE